MKLSSIIRFECFYNAKHIYTYLFFLLLVFQGIWYTMGINEQFASQHILLNAPAIAYRNLALMGIILFAVTAITTAGSLARDLESGSAHILYPAMVNDKKYYFGKYIGAVFVNLTLVLGYPAGILLSPLLGTGTPEQFGPVPMGQLVHGFFLLTVPNLIFLLTCSMFLVVMFRRAAAAYLGILLISILFMVSVSLRDNSAYTLVIELLDPFGYCCVENITNHMDIRAFNTAYLPVSGSLLLNRFIWLGVSILLFAVSISKFRFKTFAAPAGKGVIKQKNGTAEPVLLISRPKAPSLDYGTLSCLGRTVTFTGINLKNVFTAPGFWAMMITLLLMFLGYNFLWTSTYYLTTSHLPLTSSMTFIRIPMMLVIGMILLILSGETLFRDRVSGVWRLTDAMPTPSWVFVFSRWLTMGVLAFSIASLMLGAGVFSQWAMGRTSIEWGLYIRDLYGPRFGWLTSLQLISFAFFCGALFNSRLKGHIVSIAVFIFIVMSVDHKLIEQLHFAFPVVPAVLGPEMFNYSEMNGYGALDTGLAWYAGAWTALAALFFVFTFLLWNRGIDRRIKERLQVLKRTLHTLQGKATAGAGLLCLFLFGGIQYGIHDNLIRKAGYQTEAQKEAMAAAYEKKYAEYRNVPAPKITDLDLVLDLFPAERQAAYRARLQLQNKSGLPMDTLHLDWDKKLSVERISADGCFLEKREDDPVLRHIIFRIRPALEPGETLTLNLEAHLAYKGFHQSDFQGDLTYNGSVLGTDFLPFFGYDRSRQLTGNKKRLRQGLGLLDSRMDEMDNTFSRGTRFASVQSDNLTWNMVIGTDGDQSVIAPGKNVKTWQKGGRNYVRYRSERPGAMDFNIISARLATRTFDCRGIPCRLFYDPRHTYNLSVFENAVQRAMPWLSMKLGPYPHSAVQVVEKPFYDSDYITFANVTAISEARGWTADIETDEDGQYIYLTIARELARQWILSSLKIADVQGADLFTQSFAQYYAFRFLDEIQGPGHTGQWLEKACKDYEKERAKEDIREQPLLYVDGATYISRDKGGLALYALARRIGGEKFDRWVKKWMAQAGRRDAFLTASDFYRDLKNFVPPSAHSFVDDWFKKRVHLQLCVENAVMNDQKVTVTVSAVKTVAQDKTHVPDNHFSDPLEVGLADEAGILRATKRIMLKPGKHTYSLDSTFTPVSVILDPNHWYFVKNRKNSSKKIKLP